MFGLPLLVAHLKCKVDGATAIEYALIAGVIALALITAMSLVGTNTSGMWDSVATQVLGASGN